MKSGLVNPFKGTSPKYLSFFMTVLLLALVFFLSMVIALQSQNIQNEAKRLKQKIQRATEVYGDVNGKICGEASLPLCPADYHCQLTTIKSGEIVDTIGICIRD